MTAKVMSFNDGQCVMNFDSGDKGLISSLKEIGDMPLPPYIMKKRSPKNSILKGIKLLLQKLMDQLLHLQHLYIFLIIIQRA